MFERIRAFFSRRRCSYRGDHPRCRVSGDGASGERENGASRESAVNRDPVPEAPDPSSSEEQNAGSELVSLWHSMEIRPRWKVWTKRVADRVLKGRDRYDDVARVTGAPWYFIGILHQMEANGDWTRHLHNGDSLAARTVRVPAGRPVKGAPPFSWEESATDALSVEGVQWVKEWTLEKVLDRMERYNGLGYRYRGMRSPYLWSGSDHYKRGKFVADGKFDPEAVSLQVGGAVILRELADRGEVEF